MEKQLHEQWYMLRVWPMIDRVFDDVDGLDTIRYNNFSLKVNFRGSTYIILTEESLQV